MNNSKSSNSLSRDVCSHIISTKKPKIQQVVIAAICQAIMDRFSQSEPDATSDDGYPSSPADLGPGIGVNADYDPNDPREAESGSDANDDTSDPPDDGSGEDEPRENSQSPDPEDPREAESGSDANDDTSDPPDDGSGEDEPRENSQSPDPEDPRGDHWFPPPPARTPTPQLRDPLILDLDGDGVETVGLDAGIHFDHEDDGFSEQTGWAGVDDGFLVLDRNGDRVINSGRELFGDETVLADESRAENGFEALEEMDSNEDGVIDTQDEKFADLRVFRDANQNGQTDEDELLTLEEAGVQSLSPDYTVKRDIDAFGNAHRQVGSYTDSAGQSQTMTNVWFTRNLTHAVTDQVEVPAAIAALPDAKGFGTVYSLHQAMARDETWELPVLVAWFTVAETREDRLELLEHIIFEWTGQEGDYADHHGIPIDTRKIGALEAFYGFDIPRRIRASDYEQIFADWSDTVFYQLTAQSYLSLFFREISWEQSVATGVWEGDFSGVVDSLFEYAEANPDQAEDILQDFAQAIRGVNPYTTVNQNRLRSAVDQFIQTGNLSDYSQKTIALVVAAMSGSSYGPDVVNGNAGDNFLFGLDGNDTINGGSGDDVLDGGADDDILTGGSGDDEYRFGKGYGRDRVRNTDTADDRYDVVRLVGGLTAADITVTRQRDDLIIAITDTDDVLRVESHFNQEGASKRYIDAIVFDDGSSMQVGPNQFDQINVASQSITAGDDELHGTAGEDDLDGLAGDDRIYGKDGADQLTGGEGDDDLHGDEGDDRLSGGADDDTLHGDSGADNLSGGTGHDTLLGGSGDDSMTGGRGNDMLVGGSGNDVYRFNPGDGLDVIENRGAVGDTDNIHLGVGILPENVIIRRWGLDLNIVIREGEDEIRIHDYYRNRNSRIDNLVFDDPASTAASWSAEDLEARANQGSEGADEIHGASDSDTFDGLGGGDRLYGNGGDDILSGGDDDDYISGGSGDDTLNGDAGDDRIYGSVGDDILRGGAGEDRLQGDSGSDTYLFGSGDGDTIINNYDSAADSNDILRFLEGIDPSDVRVTRYRTNYRYNRQDSLRLTLQNTGEVITVQDFFSDSAYELDAVEFADGTRWDTDTLKAKVLVPTNNKDYIFGSDADENFDGLGGDDRLYGNGGNDTLSGGEGNDDIYGGTGNDTLSGGEGNDDIYGGTGNDTLSGGEGNDDVYGGAGDDTLRGGAGEDRLEGGFGSDIYLFGSGDGDTAINNYDRAADSNDVLRFLEGIDPSDVRVTRYRTNYRYNRQDSLRLTLQNTGEVITVRNFFHSDSYQLDAVEFADGTRWDAETLKSMLLAATGGDDTIIGYSTDDTIDGLGGDDHLYGGGGDDTLSGGAGNDDVYGEAGDDTLSGGEGSDDVYGEAGDDTLSGGAGNDDVYGGTGNDTLSGGEGNDDVYGEAGGDTLRGGAGKDYLKGGSGSDTYLFGSGDGDTTIDNYDRAADSNDVLRFLEGIDPSDVHVTRYHRSSYRYNSQDSLRLTLQSTGEVITVRNFFYGSDYELDAVEFADGTRWDTDTLKAKVLVPTDHNDYIVGSDTDENFDGLGGDDRLYGNGGNDTLSGGAGNDDIYGGAGDDTLSGDGGRDDLYGGSGNDTLSGGEGSDNIYGGTGNDTLSGGEGYDDVHGGAGDDTLRGGVGEDRLEGDSGSDTYLFGSGDGDTTINNYDSAADSNDVLRFLEGIDPSDVRVSRFYDDLLLTLQSTGEAIRVRNFFSDSAYELDAVEFADGTRWDTDTLKTKAMMITEHNDYIIGSDTDENFDGLGGDDYLYGGGGDDTLSGGEGNDDVYGEAGDDTLSGGEGNDDVYGGAGDDTLSGGEGNDDVYGGAGDDTLRGGAGEDRLKGNSGSDIYLFGSGDGDTTIDNYDYDYYYDSTDDNDVLRFLEGIDSNDVRVSRFRDNLLLTLQRTSEVITVRNFFYGSDYELDAVEFADGTRWDTDTLKSKVLVPTDHNDYIVGSETDENFDGLGGDDHLYGNDGNDTLSGGGGNDDVYGGAGNDTLRGGSGEDHLTGGSGSDTYLFGSGDGDTTIDNYDRAADSNDVLRFLEGIDPSDVRVSRSRANLFLTLQSTGEVTTVRNFFYGSGYELDAVEFADGTRWDTDTLKAKVVTTDNNDYIFGSDTDENFDGLGGDDHLFGNGGNDTLSGGAGNDDVDGGTGNDTLSGGDDDDYIFGGSGDDTLNGDAGDDSISGGTGNDTLSGGAGNDHVYGGAGDDTLRGGSGEDYLAGGSGSDTYLFGSGDGDTSINNYDYYYDNTDDNDVLRFLEGIDPSDVHVTRYRSNYRYNRQDSLRLILQSTGEVITVQDFFSDSAYELDAVEFADGTRWDTDTLKAKALVPTDNNDYIVGSDTDDNFDGLGGDDFLYGNGGNDTLRGGAGDDYLDGGSGNDTYLFRSGDGDTAINNYDSAADSNDVLRFLEGIDPSDVRVSRSYTNLLLTLQSTGEAITVRNFFSDSAYELDAVEFADGTRWDTDTLKAKVLVPTDNNDYIFGSDTDENFDGLGGDDYLYGNGGNDTLSGGGGNDYVYGEAGDDTLRGGSGDDYLKGDSGSDTYLFGSGDGDTAINNYDSAADSNDVLRFLEGIDPSDVRVSRFYRDLLLTLQSTGEVTTVWGFFYGSDYELDAVEFADGTRWDTDTLKTKAMMITEHNDYIVGSDTDENFDGLGGDDYLYGNSGNDTLSGGGGNDYVYGEAGDDTLRGGSGEDYLKGGSGSDIYLFGSGDGDTTIDNYDRAADSNDVLRFLEGIDPSDVRVSRSYANLFLTLQSTGEMITVRNFFYGSNYELDAVEFADGTRWDTDTLKTKAMVITEHNDYIVGSDTDENFDGLGGDDYLYGNSGNDTLSGGEGDDYVYGGAGDDTLRGGSGEDYLKGGSGSDTYLFESGDGDTTINNDDYDYYYDSTDDNDVLRFLEGIDPSDVRVSRFYGDLLLTLQSTSEVITVQGFFYGSNYELDAVEFADGTRWDTDTLKTKAMMITEHNDYIVGSDTDENFDGLGGDDYLYGNSGNDTLSGGEGDDYVYGGAGDDTLRGGSGEDYLKGGSGSDTYLFESGDGDTTINNDDYDYYYDSTDDNDVLRFLEGINPDDVRVSSNDDDLQLTLKSTGEIITVQGFFSDESYQIDAVEFSDGTRWDVEALDDLSKITHGTNGDDTINALGDDDEVHGYDGDDTLNGEGGNDRLYGGEGNDTINGGAGNDELYGGDGNDILRGGAGDDILRGRTGDDVFHGGAGDDFLSGGTGGDTYVFGTEFGTDTIRNYDAQAEGSTDIARFDHVSIEDLWFSRSGNNLRISVVGTDDQVIVRKWYDSAKNRLDRIEAGSSVLLDNQVEQLVSAMAAYDVPSGAGNAISQDVKDDLQSVIAATFIGYETDDTIIGSETDDTIIGLGGNDIIYGGAGDDILRGRTGDDVFHGGAGDDFLSGGTGGDTYVFGTEFGTDTIRNYDAQAEGSTDIARFDHVSIEDLWFSRSGNNLRISVVGTDDQVIVRKWYDSAKNRLDRIEAGSSVLLDNQVEQLVSAMAAYDVPSGAGNVISQDVKDDLQSVIAATWQAS